MRHLLLLSLTFLFLSCSEHVSKPKETENPVDLKDPFTSFTWHLKKSDPFFLTRWQIDSNAHIDVEPAWKYSRGQGVRVAVIDVNIDPNHEDLKDNVFATYNAKTGKPTLEPENSDYHGTGVAGMIGAVGNNGIGISGVAPNVELILISTSHQFPDDQTIRAFQFARDNGAQVINCSWGSYNVSDALSAVIKEMYEAGIVIVFAAGNYGDDLDIKTIHDESELPWVIGVGSSDESNDVWLGSDYGSNLDIIAPGGSLKLGVLCLDGMNELGYGDHTEQTNENYTFSHGCSFAAPVIAGVSALILGVNPSLTPDEVREILINTTDKVGDESTVYNNSGYNERRFYGKVNAGKAVQMAY